MERIAIDAEPLIAYYWDEPGVDAVDAVLRDVEEGTVDGWVNTITCTEVRYVCARDDPEQALQYVSRVRDWFNVVSAEAVWEEAAAVKRGHTTALGDAFTVATAAAKDATAYVGADDDFDDVDVDVRRFRDEGV